MFKNLLNEIHNVVHSLAHIALIPLVAVLEAAQVIITRVLKELSKV